MRELKVLLVVACFFPQQGIALTNGMYSYTAEPLMRNVGSPTVRRLRTARRFVQTTISAVSRSTLTSVIPGMLDTVSSEELSHLEVSIEKCLAHLQAERRRRRTAQLARSAFRQARSPSKASRAHALRPRTAPVPAAIPEHDDHTDDLGHHSDDGGGGASGGDAVDALHTPGARHVMSPASVASDGELSASPGSSGHSLHDDEDAFADSGHWQVLGSSHAADGDHSASSALRRRARKYKSIGTFSTAPPAQ